MHLFIDFSNITFNRFLFDNCGNYLNHVKASSQEGFPSTALSTWPTLAIYQSDYRDKPAINTRM